jgi:hypothetical protein
MSKLGDALRKLFKKAPPKIGDLLVSLGYLEEQALEQALDQKNDIQLGEYLVRYGYVKQSQLQEVLLLQSEIAKYPHDKALIVLRYRADEYRKTLALINRQTTACELQEECA